MAAYAISIYLAAVSKFEKVAVCYEQVCVHIDSFTGICVSVSEGLSTARREAGNFMATYGF